MARWASTTKKSKTLESLVLWLQATIAQALVQLLHHHHHFYYYHPYNSQREKQQMLLAIFCHVLVFVSG
jgi:hypothetical protein